MLFKSILYEKDRDGYRFIMFYVEAKYKLYLASSFF